MSETVCEKLGEERYEIETCSYFNLEAILDSIIERYPSLVYSYMPQSRHDWLCKHNDIAVVVSNDKHFLLKLFDAVKEYKDDYLWVQVDDRYAENEVNK